MTQSVARKGDPVFSEADSHPEANSPPMPVTGSITEGSANVFCNNLPVARKGDAGKHAACAGPNTFTIAAGAEKSYANNLPVARAGDATEHCGSKKPGGTLGKILNLTSFNTFAG